jgi:TfoX/Sxy family transcriptional regulator of competence genes
MMRRVPNSLYLHAVGYDEGTAERVRRVLSGRRDVVEKRMVGGLSFMVNGNMCCGVAGEALMVRVGQQGYEQALAMPHVRPMEFAGRALAAFVCVDPPGYRSEKALRAWVQRGIDFVATLPPKRPGQGGTYGSG